MSLFGFMSVYAHPLLQYVRVNPGLKLVLFWQRFIIIFY